MLELKASLRVYAKGYSLKEVRDELGCTEDEGYSEGDPTYSRKSNYDETMWVKHTKNSDFRDLNDHLKELIEWVENHETQYRKVISKNKNYSDIFCFLSSDNGQGGTHISPEIMKRLSDLDLMLVFDLHLGEEG